MQWFKVPEKIYFESGSIAYLEKMPNIERAFIVTDEGMVKLGYVDKILYHLRNRHQYVRFIIWHQLCEARRRAYEHSEIYTEICGSSQ